jgi:hypothetical protein
MTVETRRRRVQNATPNKTVRETSGRYSTVPKKDTVHTRVEKRLDKTIDAVVRDYGEALRRLEDF